MGFRGHGTEDIHTFRVRHGDMGYESEISLGSSEVSQLSCLLFSTVRIRRAQAIRFSTGTSDPFSTGTSDPPPLLFCLRTSTISKLTTFIPSGRSHCPWTAARDLVV